MDNRSDLGKILKQRRVMIPLTLKQLAAESGVSPSHLARIERGNRFPSAWVLHKIAKPLGFAESELFARAGYLSAPPLTEETLTTERLDPYVAKVLSQEPVDIQRTVIAILSIFKEPVDIQCTVIAILSIFKTMAKAHQSNIEFAEYVHSKYPGVDEDTITMIKDILEHPPR